MNYIPNKGATRNKTNLIPFRFDDHSSTAEFPKFATALPQDLLTTYDHSSRFVRSDGLPTRLALMSSISSPFVHRSNIPLNRSFNTKRNQFTFNETPRDIIGKYFFSFDKNSDFDQSTLNFSEIFKPSDFNINSARRPFLCNLPNEKSSTSTNTNNNTSKNVSENKTASLKPRGSKNLITPSTHYTTTRYTKTSTTVSSNSTNHTIVAITEGRGNSRGEIGIAAIDVKRPHLILCQISDSQTYMNTLRKINILNPVQIVVPNSFCDKVNNKLYQLLLDYFPKITFANVLRKYFNDAQGLQQVQNLCLPEYSSVELVVLRKSYALAATSALIRYAEFEQSMMFSPKSVRIEYQSGDNITFIDLDTTQKLELVTSQSMANVTKEKTLFGILNCCLTIGGQRRLRSLVLQPSIDEDFINERLDCVTEMIESPELFISVKALLPKFSDSEQLLRLCTQIPNVRDSLKGAELQIKYALVLKTTLEAIPGLLNVLKDSKTKFFRDFTEVLKNPDFKLMTEKIGEILNDDAHTSKNFVMSQFQRCFAIKTGINGFLDIARLTYSELVGDFNEIVENLIKEYRLPLTIKTMRSKGSVLQMRLPNDRNFNLKDLPPIFIQVQKTRSLITMTTKELLFLKERMNHFIREIELLSSSIIFNMLQDIRVYVGSLYKFCEYIAELDVIVSFAQISKNNLFVRPKFTKNFTKLKASLHPILNQISFKKTVANDIFSSIDQNVCLITGANMGGKSIYIRQVALLQIMAQIGCYVPAETAHFRITDRIFARIGFNDSIECNASSFILELKEMQYILNSLTPRTLIIIDELCRGTSTEEGTCIAWAICEKLLESQAFTFFTTHFLYLTKLEDLYCNVMNYHFEALEVNPENGDLATLIYTHRLVPGVLKLDHYGLKLARNTALPDKVLRLSEKTAKKLSLQWKASSIAKNSVSESKQINNVIITLLEELDNDTLNLSSVQEICEYVKSLNLPCFENLSQETVGIHSPNENDTDSNSDFVFLPKNYSEFSSDQESMSEFQDFSSRFTPKTDDENVEMAISNEDEEMEFNLSNDENMENISQFSIYNSQLGNMHENITSEDKVSCENNHSIDESAISEITSQNSSSENSGRIALGFVMSKKLETFNFQPKYDDSKFWRMNQTTFTIQSIMKGKMNKPDVEKNANF